MTEDQIERIAERKMDALDKRFMAGELSQAEYDKAVKALDQWTKDQCKANKVSDVSGYRPTKRYQVQPVTYAKHDHWFLVEDTWTRTVKGKYQDKSQAQARARTLNSRNGGK
jgi:hypothetical protein